MEGEEMFGVGHASAMEDMLGASAPPADNMDMMPQDEDCYYVPEHQPSREELRLCKTPSRSCLPPAHAHSPSPPLSHTHTLSL